MKRRLIISEEEKNRILNLHETRKNKEWNLIGEQVTGNPGIPVVGATPEVSSVTNTPTQAAPTTPTTPSNTPQKPNNENGVYNNDKDYDYKKEGDKYFFKLKENPVSDKAQAHKKQNKYINWTEATGIALTAIAKLPFMAYTGDGSEETFDAPVQTVGTTPTPAPSAPTTPAAPTTPETPTTSAAATTAKTPTATQNPDLLADLKTASQIRQEFRQGKKDKNKATRHYNQMVNKYNRLKSKMSPQDNTAYLQAMSQLKQEMETLSKENYN
jgi:hypothetical protein